MQFAVIRLYGRLFRLQFDVPVAKRGPLARYVAERPGRRIPVAA
jgi:hypothetical protein